MTQQPPAVTDGETTRMYQFVAEERGRTIQNLQQAVSYEQSRTSREAERQAGHIERLTLHSEKMGHRVWLLTDLLILQSLMFLGFLLWIYAHR